MEMPGNKQDQWLKIVVALFFIIGSVWWGLYLASPPAPKTVDAPIDEFSAARAFKDVQQIAQAPHMLGTDEHHSVRNYIYNRLRELGLDPRVEVGVASYRWRQGIRAARTQNIIARLPGSDPKRTIMLMAHYDSVPYAPGAADDASGVATILEVVRAIQAGVPLKNNLLILLTDGEELGLMGAHHFTKTDSLMNEVDLILNLEARGTSGSSIMFETNTGNSRLIPLLAESSAPTVANSLTYTVYNLLPNDTDFSVFKPHGIQGLNYAFIEDYPNYHTMQDKPANLSMPSLQHHGENILDNVRLFGNRNFDLSSDSDLVYFNNPLGGITYYPESWAPFLAGITTILFLFAIFVGYRNEWISFKKSLAGFGVYLGILIAGALITWLGWRLIYQQISPGYQWLQHGETYAYRWYLYAFTSLLTVITIPVFRWINYKIKVNNLLAGIYLLLIILLITLTVLLPAVNYLLLWPVLFALIGWILTGDELNSASLSWRGLGILLVSQLMVLCLFPFYIELVQVALTTNMLAASMLMFLLLIGLLWPVLDYIIDGYPQIFYAVAAVTAVVSFTGAALDSGYSPQREKQDSLIHATDLDNGQSYWLSLDHKTDKWTSQFLGTQPADSTFSGFGVFRSSRLLYAGAPSLDIKPSTIQVIENETGDSLRHITLQVRHTRPANATRISFPKKQQIEKVELDQTTIFNRPQSSYVQGDPPIRIMYYKDMRTPFSIALNLPADARLPAMKLVSYHVSLPDTLLQQYPDRPDDTMPKPFGFTTGTIWKQTVDLNEL